MAQLISFFDDANILDVKKIWKIPSGAKQKLQQINNELMGKFYKLSKKNELKQCVLMVEGHNLFYQKLESTKKNIIDGQLNMLVSRFTFIDNTVKKDKDNKKIDKIQQYGFQIRRNQQAGEFYTDNIKDFEKWKQIIIQNGILTTFHEDFSVSKMIGKGSFAKVYLATQKEDSSQEYAIKAFNKQFMATQHKGRQSLINEISIMRKLESKHLIHLFEVHETQNSIYLVLDALNGGELFTQVKNDKFLTNKNLQTIMRNLLKALFHLHSKGIMHRDIKPENILLRTQSQHYDLVLADFGLATIIDENEMLFKRCGTPGFVAPEEDQPMYDLNCDIFSAGVILYILLVGSQPFQGKDYKEILRANKSCQIDFSVLESQENIDKQVVDLLKKMLLANPKNRPNSQECLQHPFLIDHYDLQQDDFLIRTALKSEPAIKDMKIVNDSQEDLQGYLALKSISRSGMNGKMDSYGSMGSRNSSIDSVKNHMNQQQTSKISKQFSKFSEEPNTPDSASSVKKNIKKSQKNLHQIAIKNSYIQQKEKQPMNEDDYNSVPDENPIDQQKSSLNQSPTVKKKN